jgi:acyl carrier protein
LHIERIDVEEFKDIAPDVVMVFGPEKITRPYNLSKCLMQAALKKFIRIYCIFETSQVDLRPGSEALSGFFRSAARENDQHIWTFIRMDETSGALSKMQLLLQEWLSDEPGEWRPGVCVEVEYTHDQRRVRELVVANEDERLGVLIEKWERENKTGRPVTIGDVKRAISVEELKSLDTALVERIYKLCFEGDTDRSSGLHTPEKNGRGKENVLPDSTNTVREIIMQVLQIENVDEERPLQAYGLDSILAVRASARLEKRLKCEVRPVWLIEFPTVAALARHLNGLLQLSLT